MLMKSYLFAAAATVITSTAVAQAPAKKPGASAQNAARQTVQIVRDKMGVPHIYADTRAGLFYGAAYASAQDRLAEGELAIRQALGRSAEIRGEDAVGADRQARRMMMTDSEAQAQFNALSKEQREILRAMYQGWADYVEEVRKDPSKLPYEFKEWGIAPGRYTLWDFLNTESANFRKYLPGSDAEAKNLKYYNALVPKFGERNAKAIFDDTIPLADPDAIPTVPAAEDKLVPMAAPTLFDKQANQSVPKEIALNSGKLRTMSRSFLIGKSRTADGHPIAFQATADGPTVHLNGAGVNVAGWYLVPFGPIVMGRSADHAFLMTAALGDVADLYAEKINPSNPRQYQFNGVWRNMEVRPQTIMVKGKSPVRYQDEYTVHGPVIERPDSGTAYAMKHALRGAELAGLAAFVDSNTSTGFDAYWKATLRNTFNFNYLYAGEDGTLAYIQGGRIPLRPAAIDPRLPTPGTGEYEWKGFRSATELPQIVNPKQDYLFNWNTKPSANWPGGEQATWGKGFRTVTGDDLIAEKPYNITAADARRFHERLGRSGSGIDRSYGAPRYFMPYLQQAVPANDTLRPAVDAMASWNVLYEDADHDGFYDDVGLTIYRKWVEVAKKELIAGSLADLSPAVERYSLELLLRIIDGKSAGLPVKYDWFRARDRNAMLRKTVADAVAALSTEYGTTDQKRWKQRIFYRYYDCSAMAANRDKPSYPGKPCTGGSSGLSAAINQTAPRLGLQPKYVPEIGSETWSTMLTLSPDDRVLRDVTPSGGQSLFISTDGKGNPHIADQIPLYLNFDFKSVQLDRTKVMAEAESIQSVKYVPR